METTTHEVTVRDSTERAEYLDGFAREKSQDPFVRALVAQLRGYTDPLTDEEMAEALFAFVHEGVQYAEDPAHRETFADARAVLARGFDDCDGKASTLVSLALAAGLEARTISVFDRERDFTHVAAELRWPGSAARLDAQPGGWIHAETIGEGLVLGQGTEAIPDAVPREV